MRVVLSLPLVVWTGLAAAQTGSATGTGTGTRPSTSTLTGTTTSTSTNTSATTSTSTGSSTLGGTGTNTGANPGGRPPGSGTNPPGTTPGQPTPLALDVAGLGAPAFAAKSVTFDIYGDGTPRAVRWPAVGFAWLVLDRDEDGKITSGRELFGDSTPLNDETSGDSEQELLATDGFEALAQYDADRNGRIDARDPIFRRLRLWSDSDLDGRSKPEEVKTLEDHGVQSISLSYRRAATATGATVLLGSWQRLLETNAKPVRALLVDFFLPIVE